MFRGRVGVGHSLSEPTYLKHCQNTYLLLPTCRSRFDPYLEWMKEIQFLRVDHHFNIYLPEVAVIG